MKKSFIYCLMALVCLCASCEPIVELPGDEPVVELTVTSATFPPFSADGGNAVITYTIANAVEGEDVTATAAADWITDVDTSVYGEVRFVVAPNTSVDVRSSHIAISYAGIVRNVAVRQEGYVAPAREVVANQLLGSYYGERLQSGLGHYWIILSKDGFVDGEAAAGSTFFRLDLLAPPATDLDNIKIPDGEYRFDALNSLTSFTILNIGNTDYTYVDEEGTAWVLTFIDATLTVEGNSFDLRVSLEEADYHVTFEGEYSVTNNQISETISNLVSDTVIDVSNCTASLKSYGDYWKCGYENWSLEFVCNDGMRYGTYLVIDFLSLAPNNYLGNYIDSGFCEDDPTKPNFRGGVFIPGFRVADDADLLLGSLYMEYRDNRAIAQAPLFKGTVVINYNADGTHSVTIDAYDDAVRPNRLTLNWTGYIY